MGAASAMEQWQSICGGTVCRNVVGGALSLADGDTDSNSDGKLDEGVRVSRGAMVGAVCDALNGVNGGSCYVASIENE